MTDMCLSEPRPRRIWAGDLRGKFHDGPPMSLALIVYSKIVISVGDCLSDFRLDVGLVSESLVHARRSAVEQFTNGNVAFGRVLLGISLRQQVFRQKRIDRDGLVGFESSRFFPRPGRAFELLFPIERLARPGRGRVRALASARLARTASHELIAVATISTATKPAATASAARCFEASLRRRYRAEGGPASTASPAR